MEIYLVGGAVRDQLLGLPVKERDWVVVGATPEELLQQGFKPVGKDFPVFLHPQTHEEYALARTERKIGKGYKGFKFYADPSVSLIDDLQRRDLTINAMAQNKQGEIIDPYHGQQDLVEHWLRHVSPAFAEDPVRILRTARFAARFIGFNVHPATIALMQTMVVAGEVDALVPERVWQECVRALACDKPTRFFDTLILAGAMPILFPEINWPIASKHLGLVAQHNPQPIIRFCALFVTNQPKEIKQLCERLRVPSEFRDLALLFAQHFPALQQINPTAEQINALLEQTDALRRPMRFLQLLAVYQALDSQRVAKKNCSYLQQALELVQTMHLTTDELTGLTGPEIAAKIRQQRIQLLRTCSK